jgi:hypothetical protein
VASPTPRPSPGAVLEMRVVRESAPRGFRPDLVQALAVDLWRAGFPARLAPCWDAVGPEGLALGAGGMRRAIGSSAGSSPLGPS